MWPHEVVNPAQAVGMLYLMLRECARPSVGPKTSFPNRVRWTVGCKVWCQGQRRVRETQLGNISIKMVFKSMDSDMSTQRRGEREKRSSSGDFPGGAVVKNPPANAGDTGSSPGPGRSHMPRSN